MQEVSIEAADLQRLVSDLSRCHLLSMFSEQQLYQIASLSALARFGEGEPIVRAGDLADGLYVILRGEAQVVPGDGSEVVGAAVLSRGLEPFRLGPFDCVGELGLLLEQPRTATVLAVGEVLAFRLERLTFDGLMRHNPAFGLAASRLLAERLAKLTRHVVALNAQRAGNADREPPAVEITRDHAPLEMAARARRSGQGAADGPVPARLEELLRLAAAEGASDLYLTAGQPPRLRIDGDVQILSYPWRAGPLEVLELLEPLMHERQREDFELHRDADFAIGLPGVARFRVNLFRDARGVGAVLRRIPSRIPDFSELGLPPVVRGLTEHPNGLVLITGPTGSGKSTTLAAMIDHLNRSRCAHIVTLEDPIEYQHESALALINQREIHRDAESFARALRATLREDPDVVLVGELRDLETVRLSLELGNTGHLVLATLHTNSAAAAVDRIISMFPAEHQNQVRLALAEELRGVVAQTLCRRVGRGRAVAAEVLVVNPAVANLIREGKTYQIPNVMATGRAHGNLLLNDELARLVRERQVDYREAYARAIDKGDLMRRFDR